MIPLQNGAKLKLGLKRAKKTVPLSKCTLFQSVFQHRNVTFLLKNQFYCVQKRFNMYDRQNFGEIFEKCDLCQWKCKKLDRPAKIIKNGFFTLLSNLTNKTLFRVLINCYNVFP